MNRQDRMNIKIVDSDEETHSQCLHSHYGYSHAEACEMRNKMLMEILNSKNMYDIIDKHFSKLDAKGRMELCAFSEAIVLMDKMNR